LPFFFLKARQRLDFFRRDKSRAPILPPLDCMKQLTGAREGATDHEYFKRTGSNISLQFIQKLLILVIKQTLYSNEHLPSIP